MDLKTFLAIFWRRKLVIAITTVVTILVAMLGSLLIEPSYTAVTTLRVGTATGGSSDWVSYDILYTDRLMNTYRTIVMSDRMAQSVQEELGLVVPPTIDVTIPANTELMQISATADAPVLAAQIANTVTDVLIEQSREQYPTGGRTAQDILAAQLTQIEQELDEARNRYDELLANSPNDEAQLEAARESITLKQETYGSLLSQYESARITEAIRSNQITVVQEAAPPSGPSTFSPVLLAALGMVIGLVAGLGLAFLFENLDDTVHSTEQIRSLASLPILGKIPATSQRDAVLFRGAMPQEEAFRRLRTNLFALADRSPLQSILVTSAEPNEGKSTTIANLAMAVSQSGRKVVIVDADLRRPSMHKIFNLNNQLGLANVLNQETTLDDALQFSMIPGVQVLTSGPQTANPAELLGLRAMAAIIEQLVEQFDLVLIDTPSLQTVTDAAVLAPMVDGAMLVVARGHARQQSVRAALQQLANVRTVPLGIVVMRGEQDGTYHYGEPLPHSAPAAHPHIQRLRRTQISNQPATEQNILRRLHEVSARQAEESSDDGTPFEHQHPPQVVDIRPAVLRRLREKANPDSGQMEEGVTWSTQGQRMAGDR